jgi:tetratricopeptide (TPR) repeat protein
MTARLFLAAALTAGLCGAAGQAGGDDSSDIGVLINARMAVRSGNLDQAEEGTRVYLQKHPESAQAHYLLGFILFKEGQAKADPAQTQEKCKASLAEYTEGAKDHPPSSLDLKIVALDYVLLGSFTDADKWLSQSLARNPRDPEAWYYLGRIKYSEKQYREAVGAYDQAIRLDPLDKKAEEARKVAIADEASGT